jgi:hypothetical protein
LIAACLVAAINAKNPDNPIVLPYLDWIRPSIAQDKAAQSKLTFQLLLGATLVLAAYDLKTRARR